MNREEMMCKLQYVCQLRPELIDESKETILEALIWHCQNRDGWIESYNKLKRQYDDLLKRVESENNNS